MIFREFDNPEEKDYDVNSIHSEDEPINIKSSRNVYIAQLIDLIGILEDVSDEQLQNEYGITGNEYFNPNKETIVKVSQKLNSNNSIKTR